MVPFLKGNTEHSIEAKFCGKYRTKIAEFWLQDETQIEKSVSEDVTVNLLRDEGT